jgi:hypothetical protein
VQTPKRERQWQPFEFALPSPDERAKGAAMAELRALFDLVSIHRGDVGNGIAVAVVGLLIATE